MNLFMIISLEGYRKYLNIMFEKMIKERDHKHTQVKSKEYQILDGNEQSNDNQVSSKRPQNVQRRLETQNAINRTDFCTSHKSRN